MNKKSTKFFWVDASLAALLTASGISGLLLWFVFPRGVGQGIRWFLKDIHKWAGLGLVGLGAYHLLLHWNWLIKTGQHVLLNDKNKRQN